MVKRSSVFVLVFFMFSIVAWAEVPQVISFQGRLTDSGGQPLDTTVNMVFTIYDGGGLDLWMETQYSVLVSSGLFEVLLGSVDPIPGTVFDDPERYVGFGFQGEPEFTPRVQLGSTAYAYRALHADAVTAPLEISYSGTAPAILGIGDGNTIGVKGESGFGYSVYGHNGSGYSGGLGFINAGVCAHNPTSEVTAYLATGNLAGLFNGDVSIVDNLLVDDNVGIGTSNPDAKLHVDGAIRLGSGSRNFEIFEALTTDPAGWSDFIEYDGIAIGSADGGNRQMFIFSDGANQYNIFTVATSQNSGATWEADFIIEQDGDVGIGVMNPTASLEVNGMIHSHVEGYKFPDGSVQTTAATGGPSRWTLIDSILFSDEAWGLARGGSDNKLYGDSLHTHVNWGVICTTGEWGGNWAYQTVGGGYGNAAMGGDYATVAGGVQNFADGDYAFIGGGQENTAKDAGTVAGGISNYAGDDAFVGGGENNFAGSGDAVVAGGENNVAGWPLSTVGGGLKNTASYTFATVAGGDSCTASGRGAVVSGGHRNTASGKYSIIPGGYFCSAEENALAAGTRAQALHEGAFVWADSRNADFSSTATDEFAARANGGVRFITLTDVMGNPLSGVEVASGGGSWSSLSDRAAKADFKEISNQEILEKVAALPITTWRYKGQDESIRHIGPMAQDFHAAFGVGEDEKHITTIDADGVALAAIKALHEENEALKSEVAELKALVNQLIEQQR